MFKLARPLSLFVVALAAGGVSLAAVARAETASDPIKTPAAKAKTAPAKTAVKTSAKGAKATKATAAAPAADKAAAGAAGATNAAAPATGSAAPAIEDKDVPTSTPPPGLSPLAELKRSNDQLDRLLKKKYPNWSPEAEAQKADVRKLVGGFLDYRELAHRALAKHWETLKPAQRQDFVSTLRDLVERSYLKQVRGDPNYNIKYQKEEKAGSEASVDATLTTVARNKKVNIALVYKVIYKERWLVYDVITDEQSMLENYRAEFNKIINKDGFDALLKRMKKKLEEKDE